MGHSWRIGIFEIDVGIRRSIFWAIGQAVSSKGSVTTTVPTAMGPIWSSTVPDGMDSARSSPEDPENLVELPWMMA